MRFFLIVLLAAAATLHAQEADQRKRMTFSTTTPEHRPGTSASPAPAASAGPPAKSPDTAAAIGAFFLALKAGQVDAAYEGLVKGTIIAERQKNVDDLKESTKKALDQYGPVSGFEVVDTLQVGTSLLRQTCISLNQDLPLRWRFYFYRNEAGWKIVDMRVDDGLVELFEEAGHRQKN